MSSDRTITRRSVLCLSAATILEGALDSVHASPEGQVVVGGGVVPTPSWFDPAETPAIVTPFIILYALHDALLKPMPGNPLQPCLAESHSATADGLSHRFALRAGISFHNGETVTAEDVKFSFERYRGTAASLIKQKVAAVETPDARTVVFRLHRPWPDFLTYYAGSTGAGWIVPKNYVERVGEEGFKKAPIGAGPYKFVSFTAGVGWVMEAFEGYWRKAPSVKRITFRAMPEVTTRFAALKRGEIDFAPINGELAEELQHTPGLALKTVVLNAPFWLYFPEQWDAKSPWYDLRVRQAVSLALDRDGINRVATHGYSLVTNSIVPRDFEYFWQPPKTPYDPTRAGALLAEAGLRGGFDAGDYNVDAQFANVGEAVVNNLQEVGIRVRLRPLERAAFIKAYADKRLKNVIQGGSGAAGNAATRLEAFIVKGGAYSYGSYPDIDTLFVEQAEEIDPERRETILHRIQQLVHERTICAPIWQLALLTGVGPRVADPALGLIPGHPFPAPWDDLRLKTV